MRKIILTETDILRANTYVPTMQKDAFVENVYVKCLDRVELAVKDGVNQLDAVPPLYKDNLPRKSRYLMGALVKLYLKKPCEPTDDDYLMAADDYDTWAGSHVFNQFERLKACGGEVRERIFDLMGDYRDLEKRLNVEVYNMLQIQNDICVRLYAMVSQQADPETLKQQMEALETVKGRLDQYLAQRESGRG